MGCDIHPYIEVKEGAQWKLVDWRAKYQEGQWEDGSPRYNYDTGYFDDPFYIGRNYNLFSVLADVRNGYGFAGCPTGKGFVPMAQPRGLPADATPEVVKESHSWGRDGHSHSWFTLKELQTYNYEQVVTLIGVVNEEQFKYFKEHGQPDNWCGDVSGGRVQHVSNLEMERLIANPEDKNSNKEYYTRIQWDVTYRESIGSHWFTTLEALAQLGEPDNVRLVFWFDN